MQENNIKTTSTWQRQIQIYIVCFIDGYFTPVLLCSNDIFSLFSPLLTSIFLISPSPQRLVHMHEILKIYLPFDAFFLQAQWSVIHKQPPLSHCSLPFWAISVMAECFIQEFLSVLSLPVHEWIGEGPIGWSMCQWKLKPQLRKHPWGLAQRTLSEGLRKICSQQLALGQFGDFLLHSVRIRFGKHLSGKLISEQLIMDEISS